MAPTLAAVPAGSIERRSEAARKAKWMGSGVVPSGRLLSG